ncbi:MAG: PPOX class F420-dependent oxidoreductase [Halieaceae bacterium]|nr:PPOX class F420-dependent oxidoreductase [Halieaceae bacterium]
MLIPADGQQLLTDTRFGTLSTIRHSDGLISSNPVGFVWDGESLRISTLKSRVKYSNLKADPRVTFCVVSTLDIMDYIEIRGLATLEDDLDRSFFRRQFARGSFGSEPPPDLDPPGSERVIITIHAQQISCPKLYDGKFRKK